MFCEQQKLKEQPLGHAIFILNCEYAPLTAMPVDSSREAFKTTQIQLQSYLSSNFINKRPASTGIFFAQLQIV